ncbi:MAG: hypothetical protein CMK92_05870 [Pseudomonas sp.]|nr:hypothetical protein [Pseudomonas sp.]|tara:strand:+ start:397 stop:1134 length:738 start_codon:yes stop_codon:yes gene_type:complete
MSSTGENPLEEGQAYRPPQPSAPPAESEIKKSEHADAISKTAVAAAAAVAIPKYNHRKEFDEIERGFDNNLKLPYILLEHEFKLWRNTLKTMRDYLDWQNSISEDKYYIYDIKVRMDFYNKNAYDPKIHGSDCFGYRIILTKNEAQSMHTKFRNEINKKVNEAKRRIKTKNKEIDKYNAEARIYNSKSIMKRRGLFDRPLKRRISKRVIVNLWYLPCKLIDFMKIMIEYHNVNYKIVLKACGINM